MNDEEVLQALEYSNTTAHSDAEKKQREKAQADSFYKINISHEKAERIKKLDKQANCRQFNMRENDAKNAFKDFQREKQEESRYRLKEEKYEEALYLYRNAITAIESNKATEEDFLLAKQGSEKKFNDWIAEARERRTYFGDKKEAHWRKKCAIDKELKDYLLVKGGNALGTDDNDENYKIYKSAPSYVTQSLKRSEAEVAKDFATQICLGEKLKKLDYFKMIGLIKEYRDCFTHDHEMYDILQAVYDHVEENKKSLTRERLATACFPALNHKNQGVAIKALRCLDKTYEMRLSIIPRLENEQRITEQRTEGDLLKKSRVKRHELNEKYRRVVEPRRNSDNRRNNNQGRRTRRRSRSRERGRRPQNKQRRYNSDTRDNKGGRDKKTWRKKPTTTQKRTPKKTQTKKEPTKK